MSTIHSHSSSCAKFGRDSGLRTMANNKKRQAFARLGSAIVLVFAGLWAAGLAPLDAFGLPGAAAALSPFGPAPETTSPPAPKLKGLSAKAGRRITTIAIETTDPVAYLTNRPDPMTLFVDLREVDPGRAGAAVLGA